MSRRSSKIIEKLRLENSTNSLLVPKPNFKRRVSVFAPNIEEKFGMY